MKMLMTALLMTGLAAVTVAQDAQREPARRGYPGAAVPAEDAGAGGRLRDLFSEFAGSRDGASFKARCESMGRGSGGGDGGGILYEVEAGSHGLSATCSCEGQGGSDLSHGARLPDGLLGRHGFAYSQGRSSLTDLSWHKELPLERAGRALRSVFGGSGPRARR